MTMIASMTLMGMMSSAAGALLKSDDLKAMDFDDLLDVDVESVEELPEYSTPNRGYYELNVQKIEQKEVETSDGELQALQLTISVVRILETEPPRKGEPDRDPTAEGQLFTSSFVQGVGVQRMIKLFTPVMQQNNCKTLRELINILPTININAVIDHRFGKEDRKEKLKPFADISNVTQA